LAGKQLPEQFAILRRLLEDQANPSSVPLTTKHDLPATVMHFYPGPLT
jgi:hypothetical protein